MIKKIKNNSIIFKSAFTLAEVLITLGIIGVVAALTIPTLMNNYQKSRDYNAMKKAYSTISDAASRIRADNADSMANLATNSDSFAALFKPYLRILKSCAPGDNSCYPVDKIKSLQGGDYAGSGEFPTFSKAIVSDGMVYFYDFISSDCSSNKYIRQNNNEFCGAIGVDINGSQRPNTMGKDIFSISINKYNVTPYKDMPDEINSGEFTLCQENGTDGWNGADCAYRAIQEGGIKYY